MTSSHIVSVRMGAEKAALGRITEKCREATGIETITPSDVVRSLIQYTDRLMDPKIPDNEKKAPIIMWWEWRNKSE